MRVVVDASLLVRGALGDRAASEVLVGATELHAPDLILLETANALRGLERGGLLDPTDVAAAIAALPALDLRRHEHAGLVDEVWRLRHNLNAYDAAYLAVALREGLGLATADAGLGAVARKRLGARRVTVLG